MGCAGGKPTRRQDGAAQGGTAPDPAPAPAAAAPVPVPASVEVPPTPASQALAELVKAGNVEALVRALAQAQPLGGLLHMAAEEGHEHVVDALLAAGAKASEADDDGQTPLHVAVANGHVEAAERLSRDEPCLEMQVADKFMMTPLHLACEDGLPEMAAALVEGGARRKRPGVTL